MRGLWFGLKALFRQNTATDKNYLAGDAAVRLSKGTLPRGVRITCAGRTDGLGRQALARISGINFAKAFGATYVDSPFTRLGHAPGKKMQPWVEAWEARFNFGKGEERIGDRDYEIVDYADYVLKPRKLGDNVVLRFQQCFWLHRRYPDSFEAIADPLRHKFDTPVRAPDRDRLIVAVHVRRGDVSRSRNSARYTPNANILRSIGLLREICNELGITITLQLHSEGKPDDFLDFAKAGCELFLDTDAVWTMQQLVEADILVMGKSSFSYLAALINRGVKLYEPMLEPPLSAWIVRDPNGDFDKARTKSSIEAYLAAARPDAPASDARAEPRSAPI